MIEITNLTKSFGEINAVDNINININKNEITYFLGPNGAGKTTFFKILAGIIKEDGGDKKIFGNIVYMPQNHSLYDDLSVIDNIKFFTGISNTNGLSEGENLIKKLMLEDKKYELIENLSGGTKHLVSFICTIILNGRVIILDEPFAGIDFVRRKIMQDIIRNLKKDHCILISDHQLLDMELADRICVIKNGRIEKDGVLTENELFEAFGVVNE